MPIGKKTETVKGHRGRPKKNTTPVPIIVTWDTKTLDDPDLDRLVKDGRKCLSYIFTLLCNEHMISHSKNRPEEFWSLELEDVMDVKKALNAKGVIWEDLDEMETRLGEIIEKCEQRVYDSDYESD